MNPVLDRKRRQAQTAADCSSVVNTSVVLSIEDPNSIVMTNDGPWKNT